MTTVFLFFILGILSPAPAALGARRPACCTKYSRKPVTVELLRGYREQNDTGVCRIKAIIFFTDSKVKVCADPEEDWVKKALEFLSSKLKKMSKTAPAAGGTPRSKSEKPSFHSESVFFDTATESFLNDTETFN